MTTRRLLLDSIRHYWRTHLGVILGCALAALVLTGALMVGDSVKATLRAQAEARVGKIGEALLCGERFVPWPREVKKRSQGLPRTFAPGPDAAGVLMLTGSASASGGSARANKVQIIGVDEAFWKLSPSGSDPFAGGGKKAGAHDPGDAAKSSAHGSERRVDAEEGRVDPGSAGVPPAVPGVSPETPDIASAPANTPAPGQKSERSATDAHPSTPGASRGTHDAADGTPALPDAPSIVLNERLAAQLGVKAGDEVRLRMEKPSAISKDAPLSGAEDAAVTLTARVARIVGDADFGRFALASGQVPPFSAFVPLRVMQAKIGVGEKVNIVFDDSSASPDGEVTWQERLARLYSDLAGWMHGQHRKKAPSKRRSAEMEKLDWMYQYLLSGEEVPATLDSLEIAVRELPNSGGFEIRTPRVFLDSATVLGARRNEKPPGENPKLFRTIADDPPRGLDSLTYFVNELRAGDGSDAKTPATPYSMVTAIDAPASGFVNPQLADGEIQITRWLADDLGVAPGAKITLKYFVMGERRQLTEVPRTFTVAAPIIEMDTPQLQTDADGKDSWMPDFPNVPDKDSFGKWKPGFDFDATRIRKKDEEYWKKYRGTPKAFVTLKVGQELWGNRWGNLTSIRYPAGTKREQVERIAAFIDPAALGFRTVNLREQALAATNAPVDFGELFVYFSFFLIAAAAVLTGLLFTFTIEQRAAEAGLLLAVGWPVKKVRRHFSREGLVLALIGSLAGALLAALYTKGVLHALASVWSGATGGTRFVFAPSALTIAIGTASGVLVAMIAMWLASRRLFKMEAAVLLNGEWSADASGAPPHGAPSVPAATSLPREAPQNDAAAPDGNVATGTDGAPSGGAPRSARTFGITFTAIISVTGAIALAVLARGNSGAFFGAGALLLIAGCLFALVALRKVATGTGAESIAQLGARNISRRRGRSMATIAVLASGVFMVIAVDSFRKAAPVDTARRDTGTGGFAFIGESSAPIYEDLNSAKGREAYALDDKLMTGVRIVQFRVRDGDDASCLNLNRAVQPRILGVDFSELENAGAGEARASGRAGLQPAAPGILPGAPDVANAPANTKPADKKIERPATNDRLSTTEGPGRIPGPAGKIPALPVTARPTTPDAAGEGADGGARGRARSPFSLVWSGVKAKDASAIPGVVDANTLQWAMQKKLGDVLEVPGERGGKVRVEFAATVDGSVLQGLVIIPERDFVQKFPNTAGYRFFLVDCPREKADAVREHLTRQLGDRGLELVSATKRLAEFNEVENTYLSIFQVLGGLGMLLGSAGLGIVVARNVFERRREFGLLEAIGFTPRLLRRLVFAEHRWLIVGAVLIGAVSALVAVWPRLAAQSSALPWRGIGALIGGMTLLGAFWAWLATRLALRRSQLAALRTE